MVANFVLKLTTKGGADGRIRTGDLILTKGDFAQLIIIIFMQTI